jgi:GT2 family glycosyltransferase
VSAIRTAQSCRCRRSATDSPLTADPLALQANICHLTVTSSLSAQVGIGITTKDRWDDLEATLWELQRQGFSRLETVVVDDGSLRGVSADCRDRFPWVRFERCERSLGLVVQRNRLAQILKSKYYLSLDDDSFPAAGDLGSAVQFLEGKPDALGLAFSIVLRDEIIPSSVQSPAPVRYFIGCGHLLKRELFLHLGGYADNWHYGEEPEFCLRALHKGYRVYLYSGVVIRHNRTPVARNLRKTARYYIRNEALVGLIYFPFPYSALRFFNTLPAILCNPEWNAQWPSLIRGWLEAPWCAVRWRHLRHPLPLETFWAWKKLPLPPQGGKTASLS